MKIKAEFIGKTLTKSDSVLGKIVLKVDDTCIHRYSHLLSMGFGYIFEKEKAVSEEIQDEIEPIEETESVEEVKPTKKRKKNANSK